MATRPASTARQAAAVQPAAAASSSRAAAAGSSSSQCAAARDVTDEIALENEHSAQTLEIDHDRQQKQHGQQQIVLEALARLNSL